MNQPERNPDTLPTGHDPSGRCLRCGRVSNFNVTTTAALRERGSAQTGRRYSVEEVSVLECHGCNGRSVVVDSQEDSVGWHGLLWWPTPGLEHENAPGVPDKVAAAYLEGIRCIAVQAPNAAVAMFRTVVAQIVEDKGSEAAKAKTNLYQRIEQMVADRTLWEDFGEWAHHVRDTGNAGAHGEKFDPVTIEQATELQRFIGELINFLYTQPARRAAAMAPKKAGPQPPAQPLGPTGVQPGTSQV